MRLSHIMAFLIKVDISIRKQDLGYFSPSQVFIYWWFNFNELHFSLRSTE